MSKIKYNLSIINNEKCDCINDETKSCDSFDNRQQFINDCINLINLKDGKINILDWDSPTHGYIYYNPSNTEIYYPNKDFSLNKYNGENPDYQHSPNLLKELYSLLNKNIILESSQPVSISASAQSTQSTQSDEFFEIPVYYLYCNNNNEIFNIFIIKSIMMYGNFNKFGDLFRINYNDNNTFITLSYKFNIFNISLFCGKFFDIIPLFLNRYEQVEIKRKLNEIFAGFNFVNLYTTINGYKYMLKNISTNTSKPEDEQIIKDLNNEFLQNKPKNSDPKFTNKLTPKYQDYKKLYNIENNSNTNENTQDKIIGFLVNSIIHIRDVLDELNGQIPNFDKLFLMSILSYRLKEGLINTTWPFNTNSIIEYIQSHSVYTELDNYKLLNIYEIKKPIIYEYTKVFYKGEEYGNCMENTILQFLKILFLNPEKEIFSNDLIKKIVKPEYLNFIINIFKRIDLEEKTTKFDLDWVGFITELPKSYPQFGNYNFIKSNKEINATLGNLILSLKCLTKIEYKVGVEADTDTTFLNSIIQIINPDYSIIIKSEGIIDIITINCYNTYIMKLIHNTHAMFESAKIDKNGSSNILENIELEDESLIKYLNMNSYLTYSDISNYIFLVSLVEKKELIDKYVDLLDKEKKQGYFNLIFSDSVITKINPKIFDLIFINNVNIEYLENFTNWNNVFLFIKSDIFWNWIIKNDIIYLNWDTDTIKKAIQSIKSDIFWEDFVNKNMYVGWNSDLWKQAILNINSDIFWEKMAQIDVYNSIWTDNRLKLLAIQYIRSDKFWEYIVRNHLCDHWDKEFWIQAIKNIKSEFFWEYIVNTQKYIEWKDENKDFWIIAIEFVKSKYFWQEIIDKEIYKGWDNIMWKKAVENIDYEPLWNAVIDNNICEKWDDQIWILASRLHKSEYFWLNVLYKKYYDLWHWTTWGSIVDDIKYEKFYKYIIDNNICENWNLEIWDSIIDNSFIRDYEYFWKQVIVKDFYEKWNVRVWVKFIKFINIESILEYIIFDKKIYEKWETFDISYQEVIWKYLSSNIKSENFWLRIIDDPEICSIIINNIIWNRISVNIKIYNFWLRVFEKELYKGWDELGWQIFIRLVSTNENIWEDILNKYIIEKELYSYWSTLNWNEAVKKIKLKEFWEQIDISKIVDEKIKQLIIENQSQYKYKYIKYKMKYLQLKKQFE